MAIELDTTRIASQTTAATTQNDAPVMQEAKLTPVLGGENVKVTSGTMSDLEKLVARLKAETDDTKMSLAQQRISILATVLDSMADRISESERNSLLEIEKLNLQKSEAENKLAGYLSEKTASEGRITALDLQISALEKAIERAVQDGVDHREQVAKLKAQRADEQAKLDKINDAISSANAKISGIDVKIAECSQAIAKTTLNEVASALRFAANEKTSSPPSVDDGAESNAERVKQEKKAEETDIGNVIRESLDKIDAQIRKVLDESQMKVEAYSTRRTKMQKIDTAKIANGVKELIERRSTLKQMKGITNAELEAVYTLAFGYYRTGKFDEALKLFQFLVMFDHLNAKYWMGLGAVQQVLKDYSNAVVSYGYCSFLKLDNPKPQLHAAECFLAMGDKVKAASALYALNEYCPKDTEIGREYRAKAAKLRELVGEEAFAELAKEDEKKS